MTTQFEVRRLVGDRPSDVFVDDGVRRRLPAEAIIFNAPRPLVGDLQWRGGFLAGIFYAAVLPDDPYREQQISLNRRNKAVVVQYISEAEAKNLVLQDTLSYLTRHPGASLPEGITMEQYLIGWRERFYSAAKFSVGTVEV